MAETKVILTAKSEAEYLVKLLDQTWVDLMVDELDSQTAAVSVDSKVSLKVCWKEFLKDKCWAPNSAVPLELWSVE
jgi:hypothetical protein